MIRYRASLVCALLALSSLAAPAATPVPGGANQVKALSGALGSTVFNGVLRVKITGLAYTTAPEDLSYVSVNAGMKVMTFTALLKNGAKSEFEDLMSYALADKDDVTVDVPSSTLHPGNLHITQGAAARQKAIFTVAADFVPVKLIVQCATCGAHSAFRNIRFTIATPPQ